MSDDRTQAPSTRRRQEARRHGMLAHSPELTAAAGLVTGLALLGCWGGTLWQGVLAVLDEGLSRNAWVQPDPGMVAGWLRLTAARVLAPLGGIAGGAALAMVLAHQIQVGGFCSPALLLPDLSRLTSGHGQSGGRLGIAAGRVAGLLLALAGAIALQGDGLARLTDLPLPELVRAATSLILRAGLLLGAALAALGAADYFLRWRHLEQLLLQTPEEHREEQRELDGDPAIRARRREVAQAWRRDPAHDLAGAALVVTGKGRLAVVLAGTGPPGPVTVRRVVHGPGGVRRLVRAARASRLVVAEAPELASRLATRDQVARGPLPRPLLDQLASLWPGKPDASPA